MRYQLISAVAAFLFTSVSAKVELPRLSNRLLPPLPPPVDLDFQLFSIGSATNATSGQGTFDQLIDHKDPKKGTFKQRFWWSSEFYAGPGSPIVLFTPGETGADGYQGYLGNKTLTGTFAQTNGGAAILIEHRYWGTSSPYKKLSVKNLQLLNLENAIKDLTYFARKVHLPFDPARTSTPDKAPWIFSGGSYSGALSAWINSVDPGTFWAYHATSAVVEAIEDLWEYFEPVREGMPKNCSADVTRVVNHVDKVFATGSEKEQTALKKKFGLEGIEYADDFASALQSGPNGWQSTDFTAGYGGFNQFCDYVENRWPDSNTTNPGPEGVGLAKALKGYAKWIKEIMLPGTCESYGYFQGELNTDCFDTHNASSPIYRDETLENSSGRQWLWFLCNQPFEYWIGSAPKGKPSLVSRLVDVDYYQNQCKGYFPAEGKFNYGLAKGRTPANVNKYTGGWNHVKTKRVLWVNGQYDPWRPATVSAASRPGGPLKSTPDAPVLDIPRGVHCSDLLIRNANADAGVRKIVDQEIAIMKGWVGDFYKQKGINKYATKRGLKRAQIKNW